MEEPSPSQRRPVGFLDMPLELRRQVYIYCLVRSAPITLDFLPTSKYHYSERAVKDEAKSLLLVSRKIGHEAGDVLYSENVFEVHLYGDDGSRLKSNFSKANIQKIRKLQVVMQPEGFFYGRILDSGLWSPILAGLSRFAIVAQQPLQAQTYFSEHSFKRDMKNWIGWVRPMLEYMIPQLSGSCVIEVDDDDREETSDLIRKCIPNGYRKVKTLTGDFIFGRNGSSVDSSHRHEDYDIDSDRRLEMLNLD